MLAAAEVEIKPADSFQSDDTVLKKIFLESDSAIQKGAVYMSVS